MSLLFEKIKNHRQNKLPFVCYCKPNSTKIIALFQKNDDLIELDSSSESGFAFVSFDNKKRYLIPENFSDIYFENYSELDYIFSKNIQLETDSYAKNKFIKLVEKAVDEINSESFEKVVLSRKESIEVENFDIKIVFNKLINNYPTAFIYCFYHPKVGFWIGATPEQFLKIENDFIKTVALAGTQLIIDNETVVWNKKEVLEQQIVTNYIVDKLKKYSNEVTFSKPYNFEAGNLIHIKTDIQAKIYDINSISEIITVLHPTPAVCGYPKREAMKFIIENEDYDRDFYAGFLGEWKKDFLTYKENQSNLFVNLRCMNLEKNTATIFVGCGITKDSNPEKEFEETENKSMTMKNVL
ncbi:isochorismate synthase [Flavobacterium sp.]|uniref:isochorismate synthase n=1 Tax=Flavobacterium sp. TaxID=239 RepID=UPI0037528614